jgi:hypothetical protein
MERDSQRLLGGDMIDLPVGEPEKETFSKPFIYQPKPKFDPERARKAKKATVVPQEPFDPFGSGGLQGSVGGERKAEGQVEDLWEWTTAEPVKKEGQEALGFQEVSLLGFEDVPVGGDLQAAPAKRGGDLDLLGFDEVQAPPMPAKREGGSDLLGFEEIQPRTAPVKRGGDSDLLGFSEGPTGEAPRKAAAGSGLDLLAFEGVAPREAPKKRGLAQRLAQAPPKAPPKAPPEPAPERHFADAFELLDAFGS